MSAVLTEIAYAKINLALHVRAREADGYHRLETLFAFAEDGDRLSVLPGEGLTLEISGPFAPGLSAGDDNLVLKAARALATHFNIRAGAAIHLEKQLPIAAGIGGGSADAAAALRLLARFWKLEAVAEPLAAIARELGADVAACLGSVPVRGEGRGDVLHLLPKAALLHGVPLLLVNPGIAMPTGPVFTGWDGIDRGALAMQGDPLTAAIEGRNDLYDPARKIAPVITTVLDRLAANDGVRMARMSGSGATCFALFESMASRDAAERKIMAAEPGWWCFKTALR